MLSGSPVGEKIPSGDYCQVLVNSHWFTLGNAKRSEEILHRKSSKANKHDLIIY